MGSDKSYLARVQSMPHYYVGGLYREINDKTVFLFGQAIAFKVLVTIVPIIILMTGLLGGVLRQPEPFAAASGFIRSFLPPYQSEQLISFLGEFQRASGALTIIGAVGLVMSAFTLVTTVRVAVSRAFEQEWNEERSLFGGYAFDLRMVGQVGLFFLLTIGFSVLTQAINAQGQEVISWLGLEQSVRQGWRGAFNMLTLVVPFLITTAMFFQLFYFIPLPHPPRISAGIGAALTALLWEAAKYGFTLYASHAGQFSRYESGDGMAAIGNSFGLIIAFVFWAYFSGVVLMVGAIVAALHEQRLRHRRESGKALAAGSKLEAAAHQRPEVPGESHVPDRTPLVRQDRPSAVAGPPADLSSQEFVVEKRPEEKTADAQRSEENGTPPASQPPEGETPRASEVKSS